MDKTARALQIARSIAHTGDACVYSPGAGLPDITFLANPQKPPADPLLAPDAPHTLSLDVARLDPATGEPVFAARFPEAGEYFRDAAGRAYRITAAPLNPRADLLTFTIALA